MTLPLRERAEPYITLNAFGHYVMISDAKKRRKILQDMKFYHPAKQSQYSAAREAITRYFCDSGRDGNILYRTIDRLKSEPPSSEHDITRRRICTEALECVLSAVETMPNLELVTSKTARTERRVKAAGVIISCSPELIVRGVSRKKNVVGAIKLRLTKTPKFDAEAGAVCATVLHSVIKHKEVRNGEIADRKLCQIIDIFNGCHVHEAPRAVLTRRSQVLATCEEIATIWPQINRPASPSKPR